MTLSEKQAGWIAAVAGGGGWLAISALSGRREAWDAGIYFSLYLPLLALIVGALAWNVPERTWRWAFIPFGAQAVVAFLQNPTASLLPLGLIVFAIYGCIFLIPAKIGASARRRRDGAQADS